MRLPSYSWSASVAEPVRHASAPRRVRGLQPAGYMFSPSRTWSVYADRRRPLVDRMVPKRDRRLRKLVRMAGPGHSFLSRCLDRLRCAVPQRQPPRLKTCSSW